MAYTYDDFLSQAQGAGLMDRFSEEDLKIAQSSPEYGLSALKLQQDLSGAKTTEQKLLAQEAINQLRNSYTNQQKMAGTSFQYGKENEYQQLLKDVTSGSSFSYDPSQDHSLNAAKKSYLREGDRARTDTLAKVSAATGGAPSSYAVTAAQQAGDYYSTKFADMVPSFEQTAYEKYLGDFEKKLTELRALGDERNFDFNAYLTKQEQERAAEQQEYERQQNLLAQQLAAAQEAYNREQALFAQQKAAEQEAYEREQLERQWQYQLEQDRLAAAQLQYEREQAEAQTAWQKELAAQDAAQREWENAFALYQQLGYATPEIAQILGLGGGAAVVPDGTVIGGTGTGNYTGGNTGDLTGGPTGDYTGEPVIEEETGDDVIEPETNPYDSLVNDHGIRLLQQQLGVPTTGVWDEQTILAANDKWGVTSVYDAMTIYAGDSMITNRTGDGWMQIGNGRYTDAEVATMIADGRVKETVDPKTGKITYSLVLNNTTQTNPKPALPKGKTNVTYGTSSPTGTGKSTGKFVATLIN